VIWRKKAYIPESFLYQYTLLYFFSLAKLIEPAARHPVTLLDATDHQLCGLVAFEPLSLLGDHPIRLASVNQPNSRRSNMACQSSAARSA